MYIDLLVLIFASNRHSMSKEKIKNALNRYYKAFDYDEGTLAYKRGGQMGFGKKHEWGGPNGTTWISEIDQTPVDESFIYDANGQISGLGTDYYIRQYWNQHPEEYFKMQGIDDSIIADWSSKQNGSGFGKVSGSDITKGITQAGTTLKNFGKSDPTLGKNINMSTPWSAIAGTAGSLTVDLQRAIDSYIRSKDKHVYNPMHSAGLYKKGGNKFEGGGFSSNPMDMGNSFLKIASNAVHQGSLTTDYDTFEDALERYENNQINALNNISDNDALMMAYANHGALSPDDIRARDFRDKTVLGDITDGLASSFEGFNSTGNWIGAVVGGVASNVGSIVGRVRAAKAARKAQEATAIANKDWDSRYFHAVQDVDKMNDTRRLIGFYNNPFDYAYGGEMRTHGADFNNGLTFINEGGTHEENPYEGVPSGVDDEGVPNLVEEGEVIWNNEYVFSNRIKVPKHLAKKYKLGGDLTFADAIKKVTKESLTRPNDPISNETNKAIVNEFMDEQEAIREREQQNAANQLQRAYDEDFMEQMNSMQQMLMTQGAPIDMSAQLPMQESAPAEGMPPGFALGGNKFDRGSSKKKLRNSNGFIYTTTGEKFMSEELAIQRQMEIDQRNAEALAKTSRVSVPLFYDGQSVYPEGANDVWSGTAQTQQPSSQERESYYKVNDNRYDRTKLDPITETYLKTLYREGSPIYKEKVKQALAEQNRKHDDYIAQAKASETAQKEYYNEQKAAVQRRKEAEAFKKKRGYGALTPMSSEDRQIYNDILNGVRNASGTLKAVPDAPTTRTSGVMGPPPPPDYSGAEASAAAEPSVETPATEVPKAEDIQYKNDATKKAADSYLKSKGVENYGQLTNGQKAEYAKIAAGTQGSGNVGRRNGAVGTPGTKNTIDYNRKLSLAESRKWEAAEPYQNFLKYMRGQGKDSAEAKKWMDYIQSEIKRSGSNYTLTGFDDWSRLAEDGKIGPVHQATLAAAKRYAAENFQVPDVELEDFDPNDIEFSPEDISPDEINATIEALNSTPTEAKSPSGSGRFSNVDLFRLAPIIGTGIMAANSIARGPIYDNADAIIDAARAIGVPVNIPVQTIGDYMTYKPFDERYLVNMANQNRAAATRGIVNTSNGNRAMDILGNMALAHSNQQELGEIARQAYLANQQQRATIADFNRGTNIQNMNAINQRNLAQAQLNSQRQAAAFNGIAQGYGMRQNIWKDWRDDRDANIEAFLDNLHAYSRDQFGYNQTQGLIDNGYFNYMTDKEGNIWFSPIKTSKGGYKNRKKRRF